MTKENKKISKHYILFVDDEPQIVDYFKMTLEEDFNIFTALNIEDAKKILSEKSEQISVVITDQRMPGGNGVLLLAHLKDNYPDIIRILTTAYSDLDEAINSVNKGEIYRYIQKPWDFESLKTEIRQAEELFMLRLNCNLLLRQKFTSKIKVNKINRLRYLFLIAQNLNFIKNSEAAIVDFCHFANDIDEKSEINIDFSKMDMGNDDIVENKLLLDISRKILTTLDYKNNYDNNIANYNKNDLISVIDNENANIDLSNELCFNKDILKILFSNINNILLENQIHSYNIKNSDNQLNINLTFNGDIQSFNIFNLDNLKSDIITSFVIIYLLVGNSGGIVNLNKENEFINIAITLYNFDNKLENININDGLEDLMILLMTKNS